MADRFAFLFEIALKVGARTPENVNVVHRSINLANLHVLSSRAAQTMRVRLGPRDLSSKRDVTQVCEILRSTQDDISVHLPKASMSDSAILFSQQITYRAPLSRTIELMDKLLKARRKKIVATLPVMLHSGRSDVVLEKTAPSLPDLLVH